VHGAQGKRGKPHSSGRIERTRVRVCGRVVDLHFGMVTTVTALTRLLANTRLPSGMTEALRTVLPPPGIAQVWKVDVFGSKRTTMFGVVADSLPDEAVVDAGQHDEFVLHAGRLQLFRHCERLVVRD
jgi:hypothetical protein